MKALEYNNGAVRGLPLLQNIDIYHGTLEGTQDIMGLTKNPENSGGLWMWRCYMTMCSQICSQLLFFLFPFPLPHLRSVFHSLISLHILTLSFPLSCTSSFPLSIRHPSRIHAASSTKTTYVSYSNHAIWRDHRGWRKGLDRRGGRVLGQCQAKEAAVILSRSAEGLTDRLKRPTESKHETFCIVPHQTTERWDHINSQSVCLLSCCSQLIGPTMNLSVLKK